MNLVFFYINVFFTNIQIFKRDEIGIILKLGDVIISTL